MTYKVSCDECSIIIDEASGEYLSGNEKRVSLGQTLSMKIYIVSSSLNSPHLCMSCARKLIADAFKENFKE